MEERVTSFYRGQIIHQILSEFFGLATFLPLGKSGNSTIWNLLCTIIIAQNRCCVSSLNKWGYFEWRYQTFKELLHSWKNHSKILRSFKSGTVHLCGCKTVRGESWRSQKTFLTHALQKLLPEQFLFDLQLWPHGVLQPIKLQGCTLYSISFESHYIFWMVYHHLVKSILALLRSDISFQWKYRHLFSTYLVGRCMQKLTTL